MQLPLSFSADAGASLGRLNGSPSGVSAALERFAESPPPATDEDLWRYGRISELDLDQFVPSGTASSAGGLPAALRATPGRRRPPCSSTSASAPVLRSSSTACP